MIFLVERSRRRRSPQRSDQGRDEVDNDIVLPWQEMNDRNGGGVHGCGRPVVVIVGASAPAEKKNIRIRNRHMWWRTITAVLLILNTTIGDLFQPTSAYVMSTRTTIPSPRNLNHYYNNNNIHYGGNSKTTSVSIRTTMKQQSTTPRTIHPCTYGMNYFDKDNDDDDDPSMSYLINNQDLQQRLRYYQQNIII